MFNDFINILVYTLNIKNSNDKDLEQISQQIVNALKEFKRSSSLMDQNGEMENMVHHIQECNIHFFKLKINNNLDDQLVSISNIFVHLGYTKAVLNSKLSLIDPLSKKKLKKKYNSEAQIIFENISKCYVLQNQLYSNSEDTFHPYYHKIKEKIKDLDEKKKKLEKYVAVRPEEVLYKTVASVSTLST